MEIYNQSKQYTLYKGDVLEVLKNIPSDSVDMIFTSPPYNIDLGNRKDTNIAHYDIHQDNLEWEQYVDWQVAILDELYRILTGGGSMFFNHKDKFKKEVFHSPIEILFKSKFSIKQNIIWDRGSALSYNAGMFGDVYENVYWCFKGISPKTETQHNIMGTIWRINPEHNIDHPAPFPLELPLRAIYSIFDKEENKVILDCFNGSGTTGVASLLLGHKYIGIDISEKYLTLSKNRLDHYRDEAQRAQIEINKHFVQNKYVPKNIDGQMSMFDIIGG